MECLNCGTAMRVVQAELEFEECPQCDAHFFDRGELQSFLGAGGTSVDEESLTSRLALPERCRWCETRNPAGASRCSLCAEPLGHRCPRDGRPMLVTELHGVEIDICPACGGLWFDGEELAQLAGAARRAETDRPVPVAETCTRPCQVCGAHGEVTAVTWHRGLWRCGACRMSAGVAEAERLDRLQRKYAEQWRRREGESRALQSVGAAMKRMFMSPRRRWFHW